MRKRCVCWGGGGGGGDLVPAIALTARMLTYAAQV